MTLLTSLLGIFFRLKLIMLTKAVLYAVAVNRRIYIVYIQCLSYSILYILLFLGMVVFVDEFEKRSVKFEPKDRIDQQNIHPLIKQIPKRWNIYYVNYIFIVFSCRERDTFLQKLAIGKQGKLFPLA